MSSFEIIVLSFVQGITEFLPVSSSAHLILVPEILGWPDHGASFDIAAHLGTLMAVLLYFRVEIIRMCRGFIGSLFGKGLNQDAKLLWEIGFATIPVGLFGLFGKTFIQTSLRSTAVIIVTTLCFAVVLWIADRCGRRTRELRGINWKDIFSIGCAQALSLIPGTSRSGITLTMGLFRGFTREEAARFSFLLSIPVILLAGGVETYTLLKAPVSVNWGVLALGTVFSAISGFFCIHYFLKLLHTIGLLPFIIYRLCLGVFLYTYFYL